MGEIIFPDYIHYTRVESITAEEATRLLARIELLDAPDLNNKVFSEQVTLAVKVLLGAIVRDQIKYSSSDEQYVFDNPCGKKSYDLNEIYIKTTDFCSWASKLKYNLPEELVELVSLSGSKEDVKYQVTEETKAEKTEKNGKSGKSGPKKCTLSMAVERVYLLLQERGQTDILKPRMRQAFMECFREMATEGNRNNDETILELIKEVSKSKMGKYTIVTKERPNKKNPKKIDEKSGVYDATQVTRYLNSLRKNHPLPT